MGDNSTSDESSSSDYSTESSDEDGMESAQVNGTKIQLPQGLCDRKDVFKEFLSVDLWNSLSDENKQHLQTFLPNFPEDDDAEKARTLQRLFDFDNFKFGNPLLKFHKDLKAGYFRPDIAHMRKIIHKTERKEAKYRHKSFLEQMKNEVIESQGKLLNQIRNLPPGVEPKSEKRKLSVDYVSHRTKKRYFQILSSIRSKTDDTDCSSDENYPEGPPALLSRKQKRHLNSIRNSMNNSKEKMFGSTMVAKLNGFSIDLEKYITPHHNPFYVNDESYRNMLHQHKRRKLECPNDPELYTKGIKMSQVINRTNLPFIKNMPTKSPISENRLLTKRRIKKEPPIARKLPDYGFINRNNRIYQHSSNSESDSDSMIDAVTLPNHLKRVRQNKLLKSIPHTHIPKLKQEIKTEPLFETHSAPILNTTLTSLNVDVSTLRSPETPVKFEKLSPIKVEDLDSIDIMNTPIELEQSDIDVIGLSVKPELMQETHANFFSLIRDVICSTTDHRMNMYTLQERLKAWQENPISPLNDWYSYTDNWISILPSAITFLCGNASEQPDDFVPYMEYKLTLDVYQWIGAGRDSDQLLSNLCHFWLEHRNEGKLLSPTDHDVDVIDRDSTPPPPRCPTAWTVRKATPEEIRVYREQERRRYDTPHKAFTYRCNGYESVVGPLKGMYNPTVGSTKARGHTMLNADRPNFVTILSLVRDAAARLPNGEGTRADICELLKSSQYISSTAPDNILQSVVSGALDRMHTQWDPCVRYDQKKKIWIYLHRHRSEEDFERIHQQYQGIHKSKKSTTKKSPAKPKPPRPEKTVKTLKTEILQPQPQTSQSHDTPQKVKAVRRQSLLQLQAKTMSAMDEKLVTPSVSALQKSTSLLLNNNPQKHEVMIEHPQLVLAASQKSIMKHVKKDDEEGNVESLQLRVASSSGKPQMVKLMSPTHGKSLIMPTSNPQIIKQIQEKSTNKQISQVVTQQLLQTIVAQQKQMIVQKGSGHGLETVSMENKPDKTKQQIVQGITAQQLQNIKNVTLLRASSSNQSVTPITQSSDGPPQNIVTVAVSKQGNSPNDVLPPNVQIKTHGNLTPAQQQQILQTIKQKILPNTNVLTNQQQQIILKQKGGLMQVQKQGLVSSTGHKITGNNAKTSTTSPGPVVAKVLTNAAGQVISVESLLAHQKQHGSLPHGTTLRVQGSKSGQQNIIHLTGTSKSSAIAQFAVASQNNILTLTTQPKLVVASPSTTTVTSAISSAKSQPKNMSRAHTSAKLPPKVAQQLINAKIVQSGQEKNVQPKLVSHQNHVKLQAKNKPMALNVTSTANTIRMVNTANLNLTTIDGKPVFLASKGGAIQNIQGQNVILQTQNSNNPSLVIQSPGKSSNISQSTSNNVNILNQSNIVFSPQVKSQIPQQVVFSSSKNTNTQNQNITQGHLMLGGQPIRLQTSSAQNSQRVVLASQGQGGQIVAQQILLPAGFQGTTINIKALQGVKVIPIAQSQGKGGQSRQVFARIMNPAIAKPSSNQPGTSSGKAQENVTIPSPGSE